MIHPVVFSIKPAIYPANEWRKIVYAVAVNRIGVLGWRVLLLVRANHPKSPAPPKKIPQDMAINFLPPCPLKYLAWFDHHWICFFIVPKYRHIFISETTYWRIRCTAIRWIYKWSIEFDISWNCISTRTIIGIEYMMFWKPILWYQILDPR